MKTIKWNLENPPLVYENNERIILMSSKMMEFDNDGDLSMSKGEVIPKVCIIERMLIE